MNFVACQGIVPGSPVTSEKTLKRIRRRLDHRKHRGGRVNKALDLGVIATLGDDGAALVTGNEDHGAVDGVEHATRVGNVDG